jgi:hypothetical protein
VQVGVDARAQCLQPLVIEPGALAVMEPLGGDVGQRLAPPQPECLPQECAGLRPRASLGGGLATGGERAEAQDVQLTIADPDQVPGRPGFDQAGAGRPQR